MSRREHQVPRDENYTGLDAAAQAQRRTLGAVFLVMVLGRAWPDLVIGMAIAVIAAKGGWEILQDARRSAT